MAESYGFKTFTVDFDKSFNPDLCMDIINLKKKDIPFKPTIIWASPPCQCFSVMTISKNWDKLENNIYLPKRWQTCYSMALVMKTLEILSWWPDAYFIIENPRAMLRKMPFMKGIPKKTVTYCKYGMPYQKATDLWTNIKWWLPKTPCTAGNPCHVRAPRGSRLGIQGVDGYRENRKQKHYDISRMVKANATTMRAIVPPDLCKEIIGAVLNGD